MLKQRRITVFLTLLVMVLLLTTPVLATEWPNLQGQTINVIGLWSGDEQKSFETVLARFTQLTNARVIFSPTPDSLATVIGTRIEGGNPPDIAILPNPGLLNDFARRGFLVPLEEGVGDLVDQYYAPVWRELATDRKSVV